MSVIDPTNVVRQNDTLQGVSTLHPTSNGESSLSNDETGYWGTTASEQCLRHMRAQKNVHSMQMHSWTNGLPLEALFLRIQRVCARGGGQKMIRKL